MNTLYHCMSSRIMLRVFVIIMAGAAMAWSVPTYTDVKEYFTKTGYGNFGEKTEPNGFGGMTWGEQISQNAPFQLKRKAGPEAVYVKRSEVPNVYGGMVRGIEYYFVNGLFHKVLIEFKTREDFEKALQTMQSVYGANCMTKNRGKISKGYKTHYGVRRRITDYYGNQSSSESEEEFAYDFEEAYAWKGSKAEVLLFSKCDDPRDNQKIIDGDPKVFPAMAYCVEFSALNVKKIAKKQAISTSAFKPGSEPVGFRATKWGMTPAQIGRPCKIDAGFAAPFSTYTNASDYLTIGSTTLNSIYHVFQADKLVGVVAKISASNGYDYIFDLCAKKFGDKAIDEDDLAPVAIVAWNGAVTHVKMARLVNEQKQEHCYIVYVCAKVAPEMLQQWKHSMRPADEQKALEQDL